MKYKEKFKLLMMTLKKLPIHNRLICIFASDDMKKKLRSLDWKSIGKDYLTFGVFAIGYKFFKNRSNIKDTYTKESKFPIFNINDARKEFRFPPLHPQDGMAYATSELDDGLYIPLSSFHKYMYESKISAFSELCVSLGAKSCKVIYAEENNKIVASNIKLDNVPTKVGVLDGELGVDYQNNKSDDVNIFFSFPKNNAITKYESKWMNGEPTWGTLQKIRLEKDIENYLAEFSYIDDMGVTLTVANSLNKIGVNIGGKYEELKKIKYKFEIKFWPK